MYKNISVIINPSSGQDFPILSILNRYLSTNKINWNVYVTKKKGDAEMYAQFALKDKSEVCVIYGGDDTVNEAAKPLINSSLPIAILPGGTANVLAKEIGIPMNIDEAIKLLTVKKASKIKKIDAGLINNELFLLRVSSGALAKMITHTQKQDKERIGQLAYAFTAADHLPKSRIVNFLLEIDGKKYEEKGISLVIANSGNFGIPGLSYPNISVTDGKLDVVVIKQSDISYFTNVLKEMIMGAGIASLFHISGKHIKVTMKPKQTVIFDDSKILERSFEIKIIPKSLRVVVPITAI